MIVQRVFDPITPCGVKNGGYPAEYEYEFVGRIDTLELEKVNVQVGWS